ncbi:MAG: hypothetical protein EPN26_15805 [Rhodospirillales bacterium]|nr:MAG: hypothetical protein EPN26_15805 [Rhodospirillales bacterium]
MRLNELLELDHIFQAVYRKREAELRQPLIRFLYGDYKRELDGLEVKRATLELERERLEQDKLRAEVEKTKAETQRLRAEIEAAINLN